MFPSIILANDKQQDSISILQSIDEIMTPGASQAVPTLNTSQLQTPAGGLDHSLESQVSSVFRQRKHHDSTRLQFSNVKAHQQLPQVRVTAKRSINERLFRIIEILRSKKVISLVRSTNLISTADFQRQREQNELYELFKNFKTINEINAHYGIAVADTLATEYGTRASQKQSTRGYPTAAQSSVGEEAEATNYGADNVRQLRVPPTKEIFAKFVLIKQEIGEKHRRDHQERMAAREAQRARVMEKKNVILGRGRRKKKIQ
jgi:hypothetical protein